MFTHAAPSPATLATSTSSVSPASPPRLGRLRGLSYLRTYTHNHILSRDTSTNNNSRPSNSSRTTSSGVLESISSAASSGVPSRRGTPRAHRSSSDFTGNIVEPSTPPTSGWLPTVGGHSGVAPIATQSTATDSSAAVLSILGSLPLDTIDLAAMARTRAPTSANNGTPESLQNDEVIVQPLRVRSSSQGQSNNAQLPSIRFSAHQDDRAARPSLVFTPTSRILPTGKEIIRVGRYSERDGQPPAVPNMPSAAAVGFKSKVVSRRHCEFWYASGRWYIKDVKSSSGTFLNHIRLSSPGTESKPFVVNDGDIVQLGIDFKGGEEMIFRCVKIRVELNRGWQSGLNKFNVKAHKRLREMNQNTSTPNSSSSQDCSICLGAIAPCQSLFVAPCSHTWHYKCIRRILIGSQFPHFLCPNCRAVADLEAEVDEPYDDGEWEEVDYEGSDNPATRPVSGVEDTRQTESMDEDSDELQVDLQNAVNSAAILAANESSQEDDAMLGLDTSHSSVSPMPIRSRKPSSSRLVPTANTDGTSSSEDLNEVRTPSPGSYLPIPEPLGVDGPMTPRNDVGPFIFDGSAGMRSAQHRVQPHMLAENIPPTREASSEA